MATFIPAPNSAKVEVRFTQEGQEIENVFHVHKAVPFSSGALVEAGLIIVQWWNAHIKSMCPPTVSLNTVVATALDSETAPSIVYTTGLPLAGTASVGGMPLNSTVAVRWTTALRGRSFTGRTYHVGLAGDQVIGSFLTTEAGADILAGYAALLAQIQAVPWDMAVVSYRTARAPRTTAVSTPITAVSLNLTLDSQRRRLPGRGR